MPGHGRSPSTRRDIVHTHKVYYGRDNLPFQGTRGLIDSRSIEHVVIEISGHRDIWSYALCVLCLA